MVLAMPSHSQQASYGNTFIHKDCEVVIHGYHNFEIGSLQAMPGIVGTERTNPRGYVGFAHTASFEGASDQSHIDGYVRFRGEGEFTFPIGDNGNYQPLGVNQKSGITEAAYYNVNPSIAITSKLENGNYSILPESGPFDTRYFTSDLERISEEEYWNLDGNSESIITLHFDEHSQLTNLVSGDKRKLTIVGWDGSQWINIPSTTVNALTSGSISTKEYISILDYEVFTFGSVASDVASLGKISGLSWKDLNGDGIRQSNEPPLPSMKINLVDCNGANISSTTTASDGTYAFAELEDGFYSVSMDPSNITIGCDITYTNEGDDDVKDNDFLRTGTTACLEIADASFINFVDLGLLNLSTLGDFVWNDGNGDGIQTEGESPVGDVVVHLMLDNEIVNTTTTGDDGKYLFTDIYPGSYYLMFEVASQYGFTTPQRGISLESDSDVDNSNGFGTTPIFNINSGEVDFSWDVGLYECIKIGDLVWLDVDGDHIFGFADEGIDGVEVKLWKVEGDEEILIETQITETTSVVGSYEFCTIPGEYYVEMILPSPNYALVNPNEGNDETKDSDAIPGLGGGRTDNFFIVNGEDNLDIDFGLRGVNYVGSYVWHDRNKDGMRQDNEPGMADVSVQAYSIDHDLIASVKTNYNGRYTITSLDPGHYYLRIVVPEEYTFTMPHMGVDDNIDSNFDESNGSRTSSTFQVVEGESYPNMDAGLVTEECFFEPLAFTSRILNQGIQIIWETEDDMDYSHYILERSTGEGGEFVELRAVMAEGRGKQIYAVMDSEYEDGEEYTYKLTSYDLHNEICESLPITITAPDLKIVLEPIALFEEHDTTVKFGDTETDCNISPKSFFMSWINNYPRLIWITGSEADVSHFILQRKDGSNANYTPLDTIISDRNPEQIYGKLDRSSKGNETSMTYRLLTIGLEGEECYSEEIQIQLDNDTENEVEVELAPIATTEKLSLENKVIALNSCELNPVEFTIVEESDYLQISWESKIDLDISHYFIERSLHGEYDFEEIAMVMDNGNVTYTERDYDIQFGEKYDYRITTVDMTDKSCMTEVIGVNTSSKVLSIVSMYPNPASDATSLQVILGETSRVKASLISMGGRIVLSNVINDNLETGVHNIRVPIHKLPEGVYLMRVEINKELSVSKLVKYHHATGY